MRPVRQIRLERPRGPSRIRTGDGGFAIHCLTAWLRGQPSHAILASLPFSVNRSRNEKTLAIARVCTSEESGIRESNPLANLFPCHAPEVGAVAVTVRTHDLALGDLREDQTDRLLLPDQLRDPHHLLAARMVKVHLPGSVLDATVRARTRLLLFHQLDEPPLPFSIPEVVLPFVGLVVSLPVLSSAGTAIGVVTDSIRVPDFTVELIQGFVLATERSSSRFHACSPSEVGQESGIWESNPSS